MTVYFVSIGLTWAIAVFYIQRIIWQRNDPLYEFLKRIESNLFWIVILLCLLGFLVIFIYYWRKTLGFIDFIVEASSSLTEQDDTIIELPNELRQIEIQMNRARQSVLRNTRLAKEAEQRKNDLIVYLAHDIKTPLTSVIGYLSLLDEASDMPAVQKAKYVSITLDKAERLERLIDEFFEITRYNFQTITLTKKKIDLYYMLAQLTDEFYPQLVIGGKQAVVHAAEDLTVFADADKLARVFNNIMKNAVVYSDDNSIIEITAGISGDNVIIAFKNSGSIPQEKLTAIFERFFRLDDARSSGTGGAGLGLAIAKEIVTRHGGRIYAESDDTFTTFTVEIPV
jgi:two-component system sensor histidine kinase VanS